MIYGIKSKNDRRNYIESWRQQLEIATSVAIYELGLFYYNIFEELRTHT